MPLLGDERRRRRAEEDQERRQLPRRLRRELAVGLEHLLGLLERPRDEAALHHRPDLVQPEREAGDDAQVRAGAAHRPEEVGVLVAARPADPPVGRHDLDLEQVVDRPAEPARQIAEAAAQGEAGDSDLRDEAERGGKAVALGRAVDVAEQAAGADVGHPLVRVDRHTAHPRHVERHPGLGDRRARDVVAAALHAEERAVVAREPDRRRDVLCGGRLEHDRRLGGDHPVPDQNGLIPARLAGPKDATREAPLERRQPSERELHRPAVAPRHLDCLGLCHAISLLGRRHSTVGREARSRIGGSTQLPPAGGMGGSTQGVRSSGARRRRRRRPCGRGCRAWRGCCSRAARPSARSARGGWRSPCSSGRRPAVAAPRPPGA